MTGKIIVKNLSDHKAEIDIEGVIGVPENEQFGDSEGKVSTYESLRTAIGSIKELTVPEVIVNIRSTGGNVHDAMLIYEALVNLDARVTTRCYGYAASAATIIAQAGCEGGREVSANSLYLIHRSECTSEGNSFEISSMMQMLEQTDKRIAAIYSARSGRDESLFFELMNRNNGNGKWMSPEEVVEYGLADRIIDKPSRRGSEDAAPTDGSAKRPVRNQAFTRKLYALLEMLGITFTVEDPGDGQPQEQGEALPEGTAADNILEKVIGDQQSVIRNLKNRVTVLEAQNARFLAGATATRPKEDPSVHEIRRSANDEAYNKDLQKFR